MQEHSLPGRERLLLTLWDVACDRAEEGEPVVARVQKHKGPVRGLDFNPFKPNLLASGATESEVCSLHRIKGSSLCRDCGTIVFDLVHKGQQPA